MAFETNIEASLACADFLPRVLHIAQFAATSGMEGALATYNMPDNSVRCSPTLTPSASYRERCDIDTREIDIKPLLINRNGWRTNTLLTVHSHPPDAETINGYPRPSKNDLEIDHIIWSALGDIPSGIVQIVEEKPLLVLYGLHREASRYVISDANTQ